MTHLVRRSDLLDYATFTDHREALWPTVAAAKRHRRVTLGPYLTLLFENATTVRWQVQEMMRVERLVREADIHHELETYNALLGGPGELGAVLLVEIAEEARRPELLRAWRPLPGHLFAVSGDGRRAAATFDMAQVGDDRLSSVQYIRFPVGADVPARIVIDLEGLACDVALTLETRHALGEDLDPG